MNGCRKLIIPKDGVAGISDLQPVGQKHRWQPGLVTSFWPGGGGQSCRAEPLTCGIWCHHQVDRVRTELNSRTPRWYPRIKNWVGGAKAPPPTPHIWKIGDQNLSWCQNPQHTRHTPPGTPHHQHSPTSTYGCRRAIIVRFSEFPRSVFWCWWWFLFHHWLWEGNHQKYFINKDIPLSLVLKLFTKTRIRTKNWNGLGNIFLLGPPSWFLFWMDSVLFSYHSGVTANRRAGENLHIPLAPFSSFSLAVFFFPILCGLFSSVSPVASIPSFVLH